MSKKHLRDIAIAILIIFIATLVAYPLIFGTDRKAAHAPPAEIELHH